MTKECPDPMERSATAATDLPYRRNAGVVLTDGAGRVWAGERIDTPGAWQMPQGGIDRGETPRAAALRELEEETGIAPERVTVLGETAGWTTYDLPAELLGQLWGGRYRGQKQRWVLMRFEGTDDEVRLDRGNPEFAAWGWFTPDELIGKIVPFKREVYRAVFAEFGDRL